MTKPLFKIQSVTKKKQNKNKKKHKKHPTFVSHVTVQRRISTKLCMKIEDFRTIFAPPDYFNPTSIVSELGDAENFGEKCPIAVFAYNFLIYQPNRTKC